MSGQPFAVRTVPTERPATGPSRDRHAVSLGKSSAPAVLDLIGLMLLAANVAWVHAAGLMAGGLPDPVAEVFLACAVAYVLGRWGGSFSPSLVPGALVAIAALVAFVTPDVLSSSALSGPFGYSNAKGAFFAQAVVAGTLFVLSSKGPLPRLVGVAATAWFGFISFAARSTAASALLTTLLPISLAVGVRQATRRAIVALAGLFVLALAITAFLGERHWNDGRAGPLGRALDATVSERRLVLWHEALVLIRLNPGVGVGPGRFGQVSPTAQRDPDARWAHNEFLQHGAETGIVGLALLCLVFLWGFARLWITAEGWPAFMGAASLTLLGVHASVDYVMHFPLIPIFAAAIVGTGSAVPRRALRSTR